MSDEKNPLVHRTVVNIFVRDAQGRVLLLRRYGTETGRGFYAVPGGRMEPTDDSLLHAAARELFEEVGLRVAHEHLHFAGVCERPPMDGRLTTRALQFFFVADVFEGEPVNMEPDKHDALDWFAPDALPEALHPVDRRILEDGFAGKLYVD